MPGNIVKGDARGQLPDGGRGATLQLHRLVLPIHALVLVINRPVEPDAPLREGVVGQQAEIGEQLQRGRAIQAGEAAFQDPPLPLEFDTGLRLLPVQLFELILQPVAGVLQDPPRPLEIAGGLVDFLEKGWESATRSRQRRSTPWIQSRNRPSSIPARTGLRPANFFVSRSMVSSMTASSHCRREDRNRLRLLRRVKEKGK